MLTLHQALEMTPWRLLLFIGRQRGLVLSSKIRKKALVNTLAHHLPQPSNLQAALDNLSDAGQAALTDLLLAGGSLPLSPLLPHYGPLRPFRELPGHYPAKKLPPNPEPLSALERLRALGLIFQDRATGQLFIPTDVLPLLPQTHIPAPAASPPSSDPAPVDLLCHDLTLLLALLHKEETRLLHGRWLPPAFLAQWGQFCAVSPILSRANSELQTNRRRFLHYLALAAGFLSGPTPAPKTRSNWQPGPGIITPPDPPGDAASITIGRGLESSGQGAVDRGQLSLPTTHYSLSTTPAAWLWLHSPYPDRLHTLWQAWTQPNLGLWQRFRLPGHDWLVRPDLLLAAIHQGLAQIDPADPARFAALLLKLQPDLLNLSPATLLERETELCQTITQILTGPLVWLGLLSMNNEKLTINYSPFTIDNSSPPPPTYAKFAVQSNIQPDPFESFLTLTLPPNTLPDPLDLMNIIQLGIMKDEGGMMKANAIYHSPFTIHHLPFIVHPSSFIAALHAGWSPQAIRDALTRLAERPLTGQETTLLQTWAKAAGRMTIRHAAILEVTDPDIITRLAATRRGRALIHRTLSPRAIVVDPAKLPLLIRRLTEQEGVPPQIISSDSTPRKGNGVKLSPPGPPKGGERSGIPPSGGLGGPETAIPHSYLTVQLYRSLDQFIRLPARIPQQLLDHLTAGLTPTDLAAAEVAVEQILSDLRRLIDGFSPYPPWPQDNVPVEESLAAIKTAQAAGQNVQLLYYAAGADTITRRVVEPYRVQWHGGQVESSSFELEKVEQLQLKLQTQTPYLIGFCHRAQAERMFRLDRIREIAIVDREGGPGEYSPWE